jgi:hypothetical protein
VARLPGITTNVSNAGITFDITNGLIMGVGTYPTATVSQEPASGPDYSVRSP